MYNILYHISDFHIKETDEEYETLLNSITQVINIIQKDITINKINPLIIITGDIFDRKLKSHSIKSMEMLKNIFKILTNISPVIVILGNHDIFSTSIEELNVIELWTDVNNEATYKKNNIYMLNEEKQYKFDNLIFIPTLFDSKNVKQIEKKETNFKYISLYHNEINVNISMDDFKEYDYVLLGHIHKFQFIKKNMAYSGSLTQVNFGDEIDNHGFIRWNLINNNHKFCNLNLITKFITFNENDFKDKIEFINFIRNYKYPKYSHINILYNSLIQENLYDLKNDIKTKTILKTFKFENNSNNLKLINLISNNEIYLIKTDEDIINIFKSSFYDNLKIDTNDLTTKYNNIVIGDVINKLKRIISQQNFNFNSDIKNIHLNNMKFSNMFIFGENNNLNFNNFKDIVGIISPNATGKSSLIDILLFTMFNKSTKGLRKDTVNLYKNNANSELSLDVNSNKYLITKKYKKAHEIVADIKLFKNNKLINHTKKKQDSEFIDIFDTYDNFIQSSIILQGDKGFIQQTENLRKGDIITFFRLDFFNKINNIIQYNKRGSIVLYETLYNKYNENYNIEYIDEINKLNIQNEKLNAQMINLQKEKEDITKILCKYENQNIILPNLIFENVYNDNQNNIIKLNKEKMQLEKTLNELLNNLNNINKINTSFLKNISLLIRKLNNININNVKHNNDISIYTNENNKFKNQLIQKQNKNKISNNNNNLNSKILDLLIKYGLLILKYNTQIEIIKNIPNQKQNLINNDILLNKEYKNNNDKFIKLKNHKFDKNCKYCMSNTLTKDKIYFQKNSNDLIIKINDNNILLNNLNKQEEELEHINIILNNYNDIKIYFKYFINNHINKTKNLLNMSNEKLNNYRNILKTNTFYDIKINKLKSKIKNTNKLQNSINYLMKKQTLLTDNKKLIINDINSNIDFTKKLINLNKILCDELEEQNQNYDLNRNNIKLITINNNISKIQSNINNNNAKIINYKELSIKQVKDKLQLDKAENEMNIDIFLVNFMKNYDIIVEVINKTINPYLEKIINEILIQITDFTIKLRCDKKNYYIYDSNSTLTKPFSGFQKEILNIIFKVVFNKINKNIKSDFLIIDEGFTTFDENNINKLPILFDFIKNYYKFILIISHNEIIKSYYNTTLNINQATINIDDKDVIFSSIKE